MINNCIRNIGKIFDIVSKEFRDVDDLLIVTHVKAKQSFGYDIFLTFDIFKFWAKLLKY